MSWGRCGEKDAASRLDGILCCPQEWHKKQEDLFIYNQWFNLSHQIDCPGTIQNIKNAFGHNKVRDAFKQKKEENLGHWPKRWEGVKPQFQIFSYFNWDKYYRREGVRKSLSQNNTINLCSPSSSYMAFRMK